MRTPSQWVQFIAYRTYESTRQQANNAMMALLAGSQLAANTLRLTTGSSALLGDIFPGVAHIKRFNLRTDSARSLLDDAEQHLGAVAIPYALAVHEDFILTCIELLRNSGLAIKAPGNSANLSKNRIAAWNMHEALQLTVGKPYAPEAQHQLELFHLLREIRNSQIHAGGSVSSSLKSHVGNLSQDAATYWFDVTDSAVSAIASKPRVDFTAQEIFAAFAVTKSMGRYVNLLLQSGLSRDAWADLAVADYQPTTNKARNSDPWFRSLQKYASDYYQPLALTEDELLLAATRAGLWISGRRVVPRRAATPRNRGTQYPGLKK